MTTSEVKDNNSPDGRHPVLIELTNYWYGQIKYLIKKGLSTSPTAFCREAVIDKIKQEIKE